MKFKKLIALGAAMTIALGVNAIANENNKIIVNGEAVEGNFYNNNGVTFISLRNVAEALGFEVEWNGENKSVVLSDMPRYVTMTIGEDGYTIARTAPMPLGAAPEIKDSVTYVPTELFSDLLDYNVVAEDNNIIINDKEALREEVSVTDVSDETITVNSKEHGEVVLVIGETEIYNADGTVALANSIKVGDVINVEYGETMTMSIPPQNNPVKITIVSSAAESSTEETSETSTEETSEESTSEETTSETTSIEDTTEATTDELSSETTTKETL